MSQHSFFRMEIYLKTERKCFLFLIYCFILMQAYCIKSKITAVCHCKKASIEKVFYMYTDKASP